ncbi:hypothetical protein H4S07_005658, partial [Coemansia furcata]
MVAQMRDRPFQVQCCWNGISIIDAKVFGGDDGLRFRRSAEGECSASECSLFCNDMWKHGFNRVVMVPRVKLAYDIEMRDMLRKPLYFPADMPYNLPEVEKISFRSGPKKVLCRPLNGVDSHHPDGPATFDYTYLISNSGTRKSILVQRTRASFEAFLHTTHREIHKEDIRAYCSQDKFSKAFIKSAEQRYSGIVNGGMEPIFVATNLYNSEKVLPNMAVQLLALADALGHNRTFISIYENGSKDKTKDILHRFNETLNALGIPHRIIADDAPKPEHVHRIEYLAKV